MMIRNAGDDYWAFNSIAVEIDGVAAGMKVGNRQVKKFNKVFVRFNKEPDVDDEIEQVTSKQNNLIKTLYQAIMADYDYR
jgi:hypothetical protein